MVGFEPVETGVQGVPTPNIEEGENNNNDDCPCYLPLSVTVELVDLKREKVLTSLSLMVMAAKKKRGKKKFMK